MITRRLALSVPLSLTAALSLASCSKDSANATASATPLMMKPEDLASGATVTIAPSQVLEIDVEDYPNWSGSTDGTSIASFTPGSKGAKPRFTGIAAGTVNAALTGPSGMTYQFVLTVGESGASESGAAGSASAS